MVKKIFYLAMPVFLLAGLYTGLRIWYLLFLVQLFTLLLILAVDFFTVYTFRFTQTLSAEQATKGELAEIRLSIVNEKPFPLSMMEIEMETVSPDDRTSLRISLPPFGESSFTVPMTLPYRGVYPVGMTRWPSCRGKTQGCVRTAGTRRPTGTATHRSAPGNIALGTRCGGSTGARRRRWESCLRGNWNRPANRRSGFCWTTACPIVRRRSGGSRWTPFVKRPPTLRCSRSMPDTGWSCR
jgi:hypothetical protein